MLFLLVAVAVSYKYVFMMFLHFDGFTERLKQLEREIVNLSMTGVRVCNRTDTYVKLYLVSSCLIERR